MEYVSVGQKQKCFHCGDECESGTVPFDEKEFCCSGCVSVYQILTNSDLTAYYDLEATPGFRQKVDDLKYSFLEHPAVQKKILDYSSERLHKVRLSIPGIHCSSCIWLLENLRRLQSGVLSSRASLTERTVMVDFDPRQLSLRSLVELLSSIGYEPSINLESQTDKQSKTTNRGLILKIAVAGFCFGNIMLLSFPEYLGLDFGSDVQLSWWFSRLSVMLSIPVLVYCSAGYFRSAFKGIRHKYLNIDVPITLGIIALAAWSYYEIFSGLGSGYLDSLAGLLFLLLIGKWFQNRTYDNLNFNRDFKSYFPLAVTRIGDKGERVMLIEELAVGDIILLRNRELVPADSELLDERTHIDYGFVSGESEEIAKKKGDHIYAGGVHLGPKSRYRVVKQVSRSYLTQLWNHHTFRKSKQDSRELLINQISKYFTAAVLLIAVGAAVYWSVTDMTKSVFVFTSVLIVACPCALAMATPFTLGNVMRIFGKRMFYLKNAQVVDRMASVDTLVFDKTGTLTKLSRNLAFSAALNKEQAQLVYALTSQSSHPGSREVHAYLKRRFELNGTVLPLTEFQEHIGEGISAKVNNHNIKLGSAAYTQENTSRKTGPFLVIDDQLIGSFNRKSDFRPGLVALFRKLSSRFRLLLLSGDSERDLTELSRSFPQFESMQFRQSPENKLEIIGDLESGGSTTMMLGDGLNDAGALKRSSVGIAVTEHPHHFTPASDGILHASSMTLLPSFIQLAKWSQTIIITGFGLSFLYNVVGLSFAVTGQLTPLFAAILMPLSSLTVVFLTTIAVNMAAHKLKLN
jgi:Cu+-exporting ATPase